MKMCSNSQRLAWKATSRQL